MKDTYRTVTLITCAVIVVLLGLSATYNGYSPIRRGENGSVPTQNTDPDVQEGKQSMSISSDKTHKTTDGKKKSVMLEVLQQELDRGTFNAGDYAGSVNLTTSVSDISKVLYQEFEQKVITRDKEITLRRDVTREDWGDLFHVITGIGIYYLADRYIVYVMTPDGHACDFGGLGGLLFGCEHSKIKLLDITTEEIITIAEDDFLNVGTEETSDIFPYSMGDMWYFQEDDILLVLGSGKYFGLYVIYDLGTGVKVEAPHGGG